MGDVLLLGALLQNLDKKSVALRTIDPSQRLQLGIGECIRLDPDYLSRSRFTFHIPLLFWLVEHLKPTSCVTLGSSADTPHFAVCQVVDHLGYGASCKWIRWANANDPQEIDTRAVDHHAQRFSNFSQIEHIPSQTDTKLCGDESIDLLVIDQMATSDVVAELGRAWFSKLSMDGVVVMVGALDGNGASDDTALGWAVDVSVSATHKATLFFASETIADQFRRTFEGDRVKDRALLGTLKDRGDLVQQALELWDANQTVEAVSKDLNAAETTVAQLREDLKSSRTRFEALNTTHDARHDRTRQLEAELDDMRRALDTEDGRMSHLEARHAEELSALVRSIAHRDKHIGDLQEALSRYGEAIKLTDDQRRELVVLSQKLNDALIAIEARDERLKMEQDATRERDARLDKLYKSTSWRISAPIRAIARLLGR